MLHGQINKHRGLMYRSFPKPPIPPPRANTGAFDFCEKFWSNSPLCCQFRRSNAPPVRASKRDKLFIQMYIFCNKQILFLTSEPANRAEIYILSARDTTRRLEALTWDVLVDQWVHTVTLFIRGKYKFNVDSIQHDKRCYFSLLVEALNTRKSQEKSLC